MMELEEAIERISPLITASPASAIRLAGLTNINYRVSTPDEDVVVRIPGRGTSDYIDRHAEEVAALRTADAGVNVPVRFFDVNDGLMVTKFIDDSTTMSPEKFGDVGAVQRAAEVMKRLHQIPKPFATDFKVAPTIADFKALLAAKHARLPDGWSSVEQQADRALALLAKHPVRLVPSHCDPLCENFLDIGDRMYLIDYEYSGNFDPMWDLGDFSVEAGLDDEHDDVLMRAYFDGAPPPHDVARMIIYKALCDVMWSLWGIVQHVNENPVEDFWAYSIGRFERCRTLISTAAYAAAVAELEHR
jgi:thiamine kinase-like enzyme